MNLNQLLDQATPLPWKVDGPAVVDCGDAGKASLNGEKIDVWHFDADADGSTLKAKADADAALIVHAVNMLPKLVKALERAVVELHRGRSILLDVAPHPQGHPEMLNAEERAMRVLAEANNPEVPQ